MKHFWVDVLETWSTDDNNKIHITRCIECGSVKVHYKDINKTVTIKKPLRK